LRGIVEARINPDRTPWYTLRSSRSRRYGGENAGVLLAENRPLL